MTPLMFALHGALGAILYILFWRVRELYDIIRHLVIGAIVGYVFWLAHHSYGIPNLIVAVFLGYAGTDVVEAVFERVRERLRKSDAGNVS